MIIALLCIAAIIVLLNIIKVKAVIRLDNLRAQFCITLLFIHYKREYLVEKDKEDYFVIYKLTKGEKKRIASLKSIIYKRDETAATEATIANMIKIVIQNQKDRDKKGAYSYLNKKSRIDARFLITAGTGEAYYTALLCGWIVTIGGSICAVYTRGTKNFRISVKPEFNKRIFSLHADCIIAITPANIILGYIIYKIRTRGKKHASDRKYHADRNGEYQRDC